MRRTAAALIGLLVAPAALAGPGEACILTATHTFQSPKKPPIIILKLDCGTKPTDAEQRHADMINNQTNIADGVRYMIGEGYELEAGTVMNSYTGNAIISTYVFAKELEVAPAFKPMETDEFDDLEDAFPVLDDAAPAAPSDKAAAPATPATPGDKAAPAQPAGGDEFDD